MFSERGWRFLWFRSLTQMGFFGQATGSATRQARRGTYIPALVVRIFLSEAFA